MDAAFHERKKKVCVYVCCFDLFVLQMARLRKALFNEEGSYHNGRLRCRFTVDRGIGFHYSEVPHIGGGLYHLLMARGFANKGVLICWGFACFYWCWCLWVCLYFCLYVYVAQWLVSKGVYVSFGFAYLPVFMSLLCECVYKCVCASTWKCLCGCVCVFLFLCLCAEGEGGGGYVGGCTLLPQFSIFHMESPVVSQLLSQNHTVQPVITWAREHRESRSFLCACDFFFYC